jgi:Isochorismatase family
MKTTLLALEFPHLASRRDPGYRHGNPRRSRAVLLWQTSASSVFLIYALLGTFSPRSPLNAAPPPESDSTLSAASAQNADDQATSNSSRVYHNKLTLIPNPRPILADYPEFIEPILEERHFEAPPLIDDPEGDIQVRAWRFSYNARGIIEIPNRIRGDQTAVIVVHPWGIDDGQGWQTPEPAGVCDFCTPSKNHLGGRHSREVIDPLLKRLREHVSVVMYSLRGAEQEVHRKLYRSIRHTPSEAERVAGALELKRTLEAFNYHGGDLPKELRLSENQPLKDYFQQFPGLAFGPEYNNKGYWDLPVPITNDLTVFPQDIVIYDDDGYPVLRDFLKAQKVRHILLTGYATDMCFCLTTAGFKNLSGDFNVFLVGDATLATFPANTTPKFATNAHISFAALNQLVTQASWIQVTGNKAVQHEARPTALPETTSTTGN